MKILTAFALAVASPDSPEQAFDFETRRQSTVPPLFGRVVILPDTTAQRGFVSFRFHRLLNLQSDLSQYSDQKLVYIMIYPDGCFYKFAIVRSGHVFSL